MSLDLGELAATFRLDVSPAERAVTEAGRTLDALEATAQRKGTEAGRAVGESAADGIRATQGQVETAAEDAGKAAGDSFKDKLGDVGSLVGAGIGTAIGVGVADNINIDAGRRKLQGQLGLTQADSALAGELAAKVYADNYGENLGDINDAVAAVIRNTNLSLSSVDIQPAVEKVLTLRDVFDQDLGMATAAAGQLVRTGLAKNIAEALDIITVGLQGPANKADDLLETFNEYSTQFRKVGVDGQTALGLINQAMQAGARDSDIAADAIKEFTLRTLGATTQVTHLAGGVDVLNLTPLGQAFEDVGIKVLNADGSLSKIGQRFQHDIAAGGPKAKAALDKVLDGLRGIPDPADRANAAVALFGTQAEDLGAALYAMDPSTAVDGLGKVGGAADKVTEATGGGAQATIETYKRKLIDVGRSAIEATGPTAALAAGVAAFGPAVLQVAGPIAQLIAARGMQAAAATSAAGAETAASAATVRGWLMASAASMAGAAKMAMSWLIAIGPIALVIAAVAGIVYLVVKHWDDITAATKAAWEWVVGKITGAAQAVIGWLQSNWPLILAILTGPVGLAVLAIVKNWDRIKAGASGVKDWIVARFSELVGWLAGLPGRVSGAVSGMFNRVRELAGDAKTYATDRFQDIVDWLGGLDAKVRRKIGNPFSILAELATGALNKVIDAWNALDFGIHISVPSWVPGIGGKKFGIDDIFPDVPGFANGTDYFTGGLALVGERGPELVEMPRGSRVTPNHELEDRLGGRQAPLIGTVVQQPGESASVLAERLWFATRRG